MTDAKGPLLQAFAKVGRTVDGVHDIAVNENSGALATIAAFTGGRISADRLVVVTAQGPWGPECVVQPLSGHSVLPGEYHLALPGALRSSIELRRRRGGTWSAGADEELAGWVKKQKFETYLLPDELKQGLTTIKLDSILQLCPAAPNSSMLVFTLGGIHALIDLEPYVGVTDSLARAIASSGAPSALAPIEEPQYSRLVHAAYAGELDALSSPNKPVKGSEPAQPPDSVAAGLAPEDTIGALTAALQSHLDKRVLLAPIDDKTLGNIAKKVAKETDPSTIAAFLDSGMRVSGKAGLAFTGDTVRISSIGESWSIAYVDIRSFSRRKSKLDIDSRLTGEITVDVYSVEDASIAALEAVTGIAATH